MSNRSSVFVAALLPLTLALAVLLVTATALDRRFDLPEMGWFVQLGAAVLSWRLVADPGISWAEVAPTAAVLAAYLGVAAACWAGLRLLPETRVMPRAVLESLGLAALALLVNVLVLRLLRPAGEAVDPANTWIDLNQTHWGSSLHALPWIILGATQLWRAGAVDLRATRWLKLVAGRQQDVLSWLAQCGDAAIISPPPAKELTP